jgi:hypothetical protein
MNHKLILIGLAFVLGLSCVSLLLGVVTHQVQAMPATPTWKQVNADGFGDYMNKQIPSLAVFGDYIYAGTWHYDGISMTTQIWRTSTGEDWNIVDERPVNGTAAMIIFDGSIYAGSWDGHIWSSLNGITWTEIISDGFDGSGQGIARFAVYSDTLYASTWYTGTDIWETNNGTTWEPFVEDGLVDLNNTGAIASETFNGDLYWGVWNGVTGAQLWRTDGITTTAIITNGFGITENQAVSSLAVFGDNLYAGIWNDQGAQVWKSGNGTDWEQVIVGFEVPANFKENALEVFNGKLYLVIENDETGLEVWRTSNGTDWEQVGFNGFGDGANTWSYWDNATTVFKGKLYVATFNWLTGGEVWQMTGDNHMTYLPMGFKNYPLIETGKIVFVSNRDGNDEIYSMNYDGSGVQRLTVNSSQEGNPDWSPDGSKIAFSSNRSGESEIYVMNADGSGQTRITTITRCYSPQWSPDGTRIAFSTIINNHYIIYTMNPDGSGLFQVTDPTLNVYDPYWSPDGLRIAFSGSVGIPGIYVVDADGTNQMLLVDTTGLAFFAWSPDGTRLVLSKSSYPDLNFDLFLYDIDSGVTTRITNSTNNHNSVDWSPEGSSLIYHSWNGIFPVNWEIYALTLDGNYLYNLTNNPAADDEPDWTR